jgi:uncharacterized damage-inducible protein DinB
MIQTIEKTSITLESLIKDYASYNNWANNTFVNWLRLKPVELLEQYVPSSFPGIKETLIHIWDTERFWLAIIQGKDFPRSFREGYEGSVDDVFNGLTDCSEAFEKYVGSLSESQLTEEVVLDTPWVSGVKSRLEFIQHCMNHGSYHRGQVITIGRMLGFTDAPMTDYNFYLFFGRKS